MKFTASILIATLASAAAFAAPSAKPASAALKAAGAPSATAEGSKETTSLSLTLPFLDRHNALDGTCAGGAGFDPAAGFAKSGVKTRGSPVKPRSNMLISPRWLSCEVALVDWLSSKQAP